VGPVTACRHHERISTVGRGCLLSQLLLQKRQWATILMILNISTDADDYPCTIPCSHRFCGHCSENSCSCSWLILANMPCLTRCVCTKGAMRLGEHVCTARSSNIPTHSQVSTSAPYKDIHKCSSLCELLFLLDFLFRGVTSTCIFFVCGAPQRLVRNRDTSLCGTTEQKSDLRPLNPTLTRH
jgi:hypothetical protein